MILRYWKLIGLKRQLRQAKKNLVAVKERQERECGPDPPLTLTENGVVLSEETIQKHLPVVDAAKEIERIEAEIGLLRTSRFVLTAIRLGIDVLPHTNEWFYTRQVKEKPPYGGSRSVSTLTKLGESKLRREIWIERRARWEFWLKVIGLIITGLTGLLGTAIGVIAILKKSN